MKTKYVVGLYFNEDHSKVALIRKNRPEWQKGKLNGIGGKIEEGESIYEAMIREFREEAGVEHAYWRLFSILTGKDFEVNFLVGFGDLSKLESKTDEKIELWNVDLISSYWRNDELVPNLKWLIPLALDKDKIFVVA